MSQFWGSEPYEPENEFEQLFGSNNDAWRGDAHADDDAGWRGSDAEELDEDLFADDEDPDAWQYDTEPADENEPWLFRNRRDDDQAA